MTRVKSDILPCPWLERDWPATGNKPQNSNFSNNSSTRQYLRCVKTTILSLLPVADPLHLTIAGLTTTTPGPLLRVLLTEIIQQVVAVANNISWVASGRTRSETGPEGQPNIDCWPRGPAKVFRPQKEAVVKRLNVLFVFFRDWSSLRTP